MNNTTQATKQKRPSYLSEVKSDLTIIVADYVGSEQEHEEMTERLWKFVRSKTVDSYYNGVRDGESGKVKPKAPTRQRSES